MSDDSYLPSSSPDPPDLGISQAHHWEREEHRQERRELRALRKTGPYTDSRPIKHETPSPSRTPRASAIQATRAFAENDQYGLFLDSQVGENTWVDTVFPEAAIVNSPLHLSIPSDDGNEVCLDCTRLITERDFSFQERDLVHDQWREALRERDDAMVECNALTVERDNLLIEIKEWRKAAADAQGLVELASRHIERI
ncbi:hypothetical protein C8J57DRAFT_1273845 [Mycena rebaudengoi]|nr:hypothetical protein C8J57DRAFT_1390008 [Mycena rebaudengoi]KAJ7226428.1 hypothetical protein C8J57DRAFT_1389619 [Mycena rebaudengoi]KAJ7262386.1 hypothetical protein C8J57DRAFT_1334858 [Mycena rebaudengoi]KAJ7291738.1 hypothetical protein C8J57DRAFT_1273845 [Mycena rebaudengoi]